MNKELLSKFAEKMIGLLEKGVDFSLEQMPLVAKELVKYEIVVSIACLAFSLVGIAVISWLIKKVWAKDYKNEWDSPVIPVTSVGVCGLIFLCGVIVCQGDHLIKASCAPRLFVIEKFKELVKE